MALYKIQFQSSITYDSYGNPLGTPILLLEDIFQKKNKYSDFLATSPNKSFHVYHIKRLDLNNIDSSEYSILNSAIRSLEDIILSFPSKAILIAEGHSAALSLQLSYNVSNKIFSSYIINPELNYIENEDENYFKEFWDWFSKRDDFVSLLPKTPFIFDFYVKHKKFTKLISSQEQPGNIHFLFTNPPPFYKIDKIRQISTKPLISILDPKEETSLFNTQSFQKLLLWFVEKDNLQILKE
jgi:hypothetical protein